MLLRYVLTNGEQKEYLLSTDPITIGRSKDADITIPDPLVSRIHCGISFWDEAYFVRDFKSRNGTYVNEKVVEVSRLSPGDKIRIGDTIISFEATQRKGTETVLKEVKAEMEKGKGYNTILKEIVNEDENPTKKP
jgi:pSer/pThr/pTyr-binding forkhead associated (FHA) protein